VVVEYRKEDQSLTIPAEQRMSIHDIRSEIEPEGYKFEKVIGILPHRHIVIFTKGSTQNNFTFWNCGADPLVSSRGHG
jgi:hypothetical protein